MDWSRDLPTWPLSELSKRVRCPPHDWHVQQSGRGETILLLHGAGATTHTWRALLPRLSESCHVVALDLPGQGFSRAGAKHRLGLQEMTEDVLSLCADQSWQPGVLIGHSAGAALALSIADRIARTGGAVPRVIGINAALGHFEGVASWLFPLFAKVLALNPLSSVAFTLGGPNPSRARRLIESTGSRLSNDGIAYFARLLADRDHVEGTLQMMARWNIDPLISRLPMIDAHCLLLAGARDLAVSPNVSRAAQQALPNAELTLLPALGHVAHEEAPEEVLGHLTGWIARGPATVPERAFP